MQVLQVSAEMYPLLKTGGLGDVTGALPDALARAGVDVRLLLPGLRPIRDGIAGLRPLGEFVAPWGLHMQVLYGQWNGHGVYVIDAPALYDRPGNAYVDADGVPYVDNHRRFAPLGQLAALLAHGFDARWRAQIVHAHDWHAALAPAYLHHTRRHRAHPAGSVFTVHNLAFQGLFPAATFAELGLPKVAFQMHGVEFHGQVSFMKAGLHYADRLTTVSPTYAREVQGPEQGGGLDGLLRQRRDVLTGILNGVDTRIWNPATDRLIAQTFDARRLARRALNKVALQRHFGLARRPDALLCGVVSRLTEQKGLHLVLDGLPELLARGGQLVVLGNGEPELEAAFRAAAQAHPRAVAVYIGYDETLSHRVFAGTDVTLVPSRFEPCGLTQMYGLVYGSLPLVHRVGGLADTVVDAALENLADGSATGFVFDRFDGAAYGAALRRAFALQARGAEWRRVQRAALRQVFAWDAAAARYVALYRSLLPAAHETTRPSEALVPERAVRR
ncbi:MAG: glycogen synthase GlgA [Burkholderiaceae bacterium]|nr:glycogen synthase GlgA [Burkholderiaceae bacterium]